MNINDIDLNLLRALDAVLREGSVTAAAQRLGLSQPALSNALLRLRRLFGDALFIRTPRGMRPTPFAKSLAEPVQRALELIGETLSLQAGFDATTSERNFRVHMSDVGEIVFLPSLIERLGRVAPRVRIEARQVPQQDLREAMAAGDIDIAIGFLPELTGVEQRHLFTDRYVCLARAGHPWIGARLSLAAFQQASHALIASTGSAHQIVEQVLVEKGLRRQIALKASHFMGIPMILARTDLIVMVPGGLAQALGRLGRFKALAPPIDIPPIEVKLHWHARFARDPGIGWLRELMFELFEHWLTRERATRGVRVPIIGRERVRRRDRAKLKTQLDEKEGRG